MYDRNSKKILAFTANNGQKEVEKKELTLDDPALEDTIGYYHKQDLFDEIELLDGAGDEFDLEAVLWSAYSCILRFGSYKLWC